MLSKLLTVQEIMALASNVTEVPNEKGVFEIAPPIQVRSISTKITVHIRRVDKEGRRPGYILTVESRFWIKASFLELLPVK
ncbi:hypothetical protein H0W91_03990 [Patescibacteria group bacterium]|nr:hypothetical protein [Patescibacteria group bacterium]